MAFTAKLKSMFGAQDMTSGKIMDCLIKFSVPLLIGNVAQQLYNTVDSIVVGQYIGDTALAAVGTAGPVLNLMLVLLMGISTGASILTSQFFGAKDRAQLSSVVGSAIFLTVSSCIVMMVIGYFASPWLISLVAPPDDVAIGATAYLQVIFLGMVGCGMYNILSGVLRGMGDSTNPLIYLIIACLLNVVLDLLFVASFNMGVAGVAWATIIAQAVSGVLCLLRLIRMRDTIDINAKTLRPHRQLTMKLGSLGLPAGITQMIFSLSTIIVQSLTNSMGTAMIAANVAIMRVDGFAMMPNFTFGTAATTFVGQNIGARKADRIHRGIKDMLKLALGTSGILVACILLFGYQLIGLFTTTPDVIALGERGLRWLALGYLAFSVSQVLQGMMRGAGETAIPMWISIITTVVLRMPLAYLLAALTKSADWPNGHPDAIFGSLLVAWIMGMVFSVITYKLGWWRRKLPEDLRKAL